MTHGAWPLSPHDVIATSESVGYQCKAKDGKIATNGHEA